MKVLIISASAGSGHRRAAQALEEAVHALDPAAECKHVDILDFTSATYKKTYADGYLGLVNRAPFLWGAVYSATDRMRRRRLEARFSRLFDKVEFAPFRSFARDFAPDAVLATHFLPCQVFAPYREKGRDTFPLGLVLTDYDAHAFWLQPTADRFFVASEEVQAVVAGSGIPIERISVTGIPIMQSFTITHDRAVIRKDLNLTPGIPTVLVMAGGAGVGDFDQTVQAVLACPPVQVIAVAGRNEPLRRRLLEIAPPERTELRVFGFVDLVAKLMAAADVAVAKSGGLTTAECLAMGLPIVVRDPIPGQEERNADFLLEAGAGVKAHGLDSLRFKLTKLLADPDRIQQMRAAARRVRRPDAAREVVVRMLSTTGQV
jgi:processive 1,2-diacylglycerol beta-glucosyltransferase